VGRPVDLAALVERPGGGASILRAKKQIWAERDDGSGAQELLYSVGDPIRVADAKALGLLDDPEITQRPAAKPPTEESGTKVTRDKALRGPREAPKEESDG
jgi:hypothetical protein